MHLCNTKVHIILTDGLVFVNAQHNVDLYIKLRISKGQFSQQMTISEENNVVEPGVFSDRSENR